MAHPPGPQIVQQVALTRPNNLEPIQRQIIAQDATRGTEPNDGKAPHRASQPTPSLIPSLDRAQPLRILHPLHAHPREQTSQRRHKHRLVERELVRSARHDRQRLISLRKRIRVHRADDDVLDAEAEDEGIDPDDGEERHVAQARPAAPQGAEQLAPDDGHAGAEVHAHGRAPEQYVGASGLWNGMNAAQLPRFTAYEFHVKMYCWPLRKPSDASATSPPTTNFLSSVNSRRRYSGFATQ